ncbi:hypothetical protein BDB00DRAFT_848306 [Zychaea mexicana]|uniref:uncharacterized protein n=1 Tax=Zychaea mexicana TaxID=64656 RepID=UPI0022FDFF4C|nr:uncharacterized protein BDB00DRAFT_848306 [Zychaea mexicana]KAI9488409.1 hypothetical protein BDB00DRAFT_848306 [Zychaea mexicana]
MQRNNSNSPSGSTNSSNNSNNNFVHFETTPREYYDHCTTATPSYDLYPSLSRRLVNGYVQRPVPRKCSQRCDRQINFATMNMIQREQASSTSSTWYHPHPMLDLFARLPAEQEEEQHEHIQDDEIPTWDLYPLVLRNVENFGTEQMRQRLHQAMATMV